MTTYYRTQAFVLQKEDIGEANQYFIILTKKFGKIKILGKSIRKIKSKLRSHFDLFYLSEIEFVQGKVHKILINVVLIENFKILRKSLIRTQIAYQMANILKELLKDTEKDETIWNFYFWIFAKLNSPSLKPRHLPFLYYYFLWNLIAILGYSPQLYSCFSCKEKLFQNKLYFSPIDGGIVCDTCFQKKKNFFKKKVFWINPDVIKCLRIILKKDWHILTKLKINFACQKSLKNTSQKYFDYLCQVI